jgi:site-specific DNA recombinase
VTRGEGNGRRSTLPLVRCAVYTRKSTEEGLQQEFNSLDAQREAAEAFIKSQSGEGWSLLLDRYDDGGFTGGNMERPALCRLMADIEAGKVDCVVVYKVDRLSRSLLDFARMMQTFEQYHVAFISVTQAFNTGTSMGRLVLNVLLSFAQFERELISERTRDKVAATRRKGKWSGGRPALGFDVDPRGYRLVVNPDEAEKVRAIFSLFLENESLPRVVAELERRSWRNKSWTTRSGKVEGGQVFTKAGLRRLLVNVLYVGQVRYKDAVYPGEQPAIVDPGIFARVQDLLRRNGRTGGAAVRGQFGALLKGLIRCAPCGCSMTPAHTKKGARRYHYYSCVTSQKHGKAHCASRSVPAAEIERVVVDRVRCIGRDPALLHDVLAQMAAQRETRTSDLEAEGRTLAKDLAAWHGEVHRLSGQLRPGEDNGPLISRLADLQERIAAVESRAAGVREQIRSARQHLLDESEAEEALAAFEPVWEQLTPHEQARVLGLLVEKVDYDGSKGKVVIRFHDTGIRALADELAVRREGKRA